MDTILINTLSAIGGALLTAVGILVKSAFDQRTKIDETVLNERRELYKKLWAKSKLLPKWPRAHDISYAKLHSLSEELRDWYFMEGGIYLSEQAREAYGNAQESLCLATKGKNNSFSDVITDDEYDRLANSFSALRTELTSDLHSRKRAFMTVS